SSSTGPSFSSQTIHGTGSAPATVAPPAAEGFSAVRLVWMLSDGTCAPSARSWPDGSQWFAPALKRLAEMFVGASAQWSKVVQTLDPKLRFGSYHATHGTVRPAPAKSIDGASASAVGSMLSDAGEPWVTHWPFLKARTKICCDRPTFCSNVAQGTALLPATTVPPATSTRPASWLGSIMLAESSFTWPPRDTRAPDAGQVAASTPASSVTRRRMRNPRLISRAPLPSGARRAHVFPLSAGAPRLDDVASTSRYGRRDGSDRRVSAASVARDRVRRPTGSPGRMGASRRGTFQSPQASCVQVHT